MTITLQGNTLTITAEVPDKGKGVPSRSGKTLVLASTRGNQKVTAEDGREIVVGLNVFEYR